MWPVRSVAYLVVRDDMHARITLVPERVAKGFIPEPEGCVFALGAALWPLLTDEHVHLGAACVDNPGGVQ